MSSDTCLYLNTYIVFEEHFDSGAQSASNEAKWNFRVVHKSYFKGNHTVRAKIYRLGNGTILPVPEIQGVSVQTYTEKYKTNIKG
jgi:hypothetical protein